MFVCMYPTCVPSFHKGQKQMSKSHHAGAESQTQALYKNECSEPSLQPQNSDLPRLSSL